MRAQGLADLREREGERLGTSSWHRVDQEKVDRFAEVSGDHNWIHVDPARAADSPVGGTIAHGMLTLTLVPRMVDELIDLAAMAPVAMNYGLDRVRFLAPVPTGSRIRGHVTVHEVRDLHGGDTVVTFAVEVEREGHAPPVCVAKLHSWFGSW